MSVRQSLSRHPVGRPGMRSRWAWSTWGDILKLGPQTSSGGHVRYVQVKRWGLGWHWAGEGGTEQCSGTRGQDVVNRRTGPVRPEEKMWPRRKREERG